MRRNSARLNCPSVGRAWPSSSSAIPNHPPVNDTRFNPSCQMSLLKPEAYAAKEAVTMDNLDVIIEKIRTTFTARNATRDLTLGRSRELIRFCSLTIRAVHREEFAEAAQLLDTARQAAVAMKADIAA